MAGYKIRVRIDENKSFDYLGNKIAKALNNEDFKLREHEILADMCIPYVPMKTGELTYNTEITSSGVRYLQPYARYQYHGVNWRNEQPLHYNKEFHPLATDHWQAAMMRDRRDEFIAELHDLILDYLEDDE